MAEGELEGGKGGDSDRYRSRSFERLDVYSKSSADLPKRGCSMVFSWKVATVVPAPTSESRVRYGTPDPRHAHEKVR